MAVRDILLTLTGYPDPTPVSVIDRAVSLATALDAHLAAISCEVHIQVPGSLISFGAAAASLPVRRTGAMTCASPTCRL